MSGLGKRRRDSASTNPFLFSSGLVNEELVIQELDRVSSQISQSRVDSETMKKMIGDTPDKILSAFEANEQRSPTRAIYLRAYLMYLNRQDTDCKAEIKRIVDRWDRKPKSDTDRQLDVIVFAEITMIKNYLSGRDKSFPIDRQRWIDFAKKNRRSAARPSRRERPPIKIGRKAAMMPPPPPSSSLPTAAPLLTALNAPRLRPLPVSQAVAPAPLAAATVRYMPLPPWSQAQIASLKKDINAKSKKFNVTILGEISCAVPLAHNDADRASLIYCYARLCEFNNADQKALEYFKTLDPSFNYAHYLSACAYYRQYDKNKSDTEALKQAEAELDLAPDRTTAGVAGLRFAVKLLLKKPMEALGQLRKVAKDSRVITESKITNLYQQLTSTDLYFADKSNHDLLREMNRYLSELLTRFNKTEMLANWNLKQATLIPLPEDDNDGLEEGEVVDDESTASKPASQLPPVVVVAASGAVPDPSADLSLELKTEPAVKPAQEPEKPKSQATDPSVGRVPSLVVAPSQQGPMSPIATPKAPGAEPLTIDVNPLSAPPPPARQTSGGALTGRSGLTWASGVLSPGDLAKDAALRIQVCEANLLVATEQLKTSSPGDKTHYIANLTKCSGELESARALYFDYLSQQRTATQDGSKAAGATLPRATPKATATPVFAEATPSASDDADKSKPHSEEVPTRPLERGSALVMPSAGAIASPLTPESVLKTFPSRWDRALGNVAKLKLFSEKSFNQIISEYCKVEPDQDQRFRVISVAIQRMERCFVEYSGSNLTADINIDTLNQERFSEAASSDDADSSSLRDLFWHFLEGMSLMAHMQKTALDSLPETAPSRAVHNDRLQQSVNKYLSWFSHYKSMGMPSVDHELAQKQVKQLVPPKQYGSPAPRRSAVFAPGSSTDGRSLMPFGTPSRNGAW